MRRNATGLARVLLSLTALLAGATPSASVILDHAYQPGELLVRFTGGTAAEHRAVHDALGAEFVKLVAGGTWELVRFEEHDDIAVWQAAYESREDVAYAEPNYLGEGGFTPNDTHFNLQWQHENTGQSGGTIDADIESIAGWDLARGSTGIVVAVLDTGIDQDHPEFAGRIVAGWDFVNNDADPADDHFHGSAVSGLLAANANNSFQVAGVDHFCKIMPVKVLNANNGGSTVWLVDGINFAYQNGAKVISMSLINFPGSQALRDALADARAAGAFLIACAGNGGIGNADVSWPGASPRCLTIGATGNNDWRASYSGTGMALDYVAPGDDVVTIAPHNPADTWWYFNGCSSATPVAAGIVSVILGVAPNLTQNELRIALDAGAEDLVGNPVEDTPGWDEYMGNGRLNLEASLNAIPGVTAVPEEVLARGFDVEVQPNPASGRTAIGYSLPAPSRVEITVLDVAGRQVRRLVSGVRPEGRHEARWDGRDDGGAFVAAGVYFARIEARGHSDVRKIAVLR
jgi:subtilisin family serine protease